MILLIIGLALWAGVHISKALAPNVRAQLINKMGLGPYKGLFALLVIAALLLMIQGWKHTDPVSLYHISHPALLGVLQLIALIGLLLFFSARYPNRVKRIIRHPQLTGLKIWATAHILMNGDSRALLLFGGLLAWAVVEVILINKRDGAWQKPAPAKLSTELTGLVISLVVIGLIVHFHEYLAGVRIL